MPTGAKTLRSSPAHSGHTVSGVVGERLLDLELVVAGPAAVLVEGHRVLRGSWSQRCAVSVWHSRWAECQSLPPPVRSTQSATGGPPVECRARSTGYARTGSSPEEERSWAGSRRRSFPQPVWGPGSCRRPRRSRRRCCRWSTSRPSSTWSRRRSPPGIDDILIITGRNKRSLEDHFDRNFELEYQLQAKGKLGDLAEVVELAELADIHFVRQGEPLGLGHAVSVARKHVGDDPFVVMLGDDIMDEHSTVLTDMIKGFDEHGSSVVALMEVAARVDLGLRLRRGQGPERRRCVRSPRSSRSPTPRSRRPTWR